MPEEMYRRKKVHKARSGGALKRLFHRFEGFFCAFIRAQNLFEERLKTVSTFNGARGLRVHIFQPCQNCLQSVE